VKDRLEEWERKRKEGSTDREKVRSKEEKKERKQREEEWTIRNRTKQRDKNVSSTLSDAAAATEGERPKRCKQTCMRDGDL
jgi:hypothetical protein